MKINHFRIRFPKTKEELYGRLSSKERNNISRRVRQFEKELGGFTFEDYSEGNIPDEVFSAYFAMKKATHGHEYHMTPNHVTDACVMRHEGKIIAVRLSCEQCPVVNVENRTCNTNYSRYSPGFLLDHYTYASMI